jgi:hypothetical protein
LAEGRRASFRGDLKADFDSHTGGFLQRDYGIRDAFQHVGENRQVETLIFVGQAIDTRFGSSREAGKRMVVHVSDAELANISCGILLGKSLVR